METENVGQKKRSSSRLVVYIVSGLVALGIVLYSSYTFLLWAVYQYEYSTKLGINWFNTVFYHGYAFIVPALFALVVIYPFQNRSDLLALLRSTVTVRKSNEYDYVASEGVIPQEAMANSKLLWIGWQAMKYTIAFVIAYAAQGFLFYPNVTEALSRVRIKYYDSVRVGVYQMLTYPTGAAWRIIDRGGLYPILLVI